MADLPVEVWFCDPDVSPNHGCGFIGLFRPTRRKGAPIACPVCKRPKPWQAVGSAILVEYVGVGSSGVVPPARGAEGAALTPEGEAT